MLRLRHLICSQGEFHGDLLGKRSKTRPPTRDRTGELYSRFPRIPHGLSLLYTALEAIHVLKVMTGRVLVEHIHVKVFSRDAVMSGPQQRVNRFV